MSFLPPAPCPFILANKESFYQRKVKSPRSSDWKDPRRELFIFRCEDYSEVHQSLPSSSSPALLRRPYSSPDLTETKSFIPFLFMQRIALKWQTKIRSQASHVRSKHRKITPLWPTETRSWKNTSMGMFWKTPQFFLSTICSAWCIWSEWHLRQNL